MAKGQLNRVQMRYLTKNYNIEDAQLLNNMTFYDYLLRLEKLARSIFEWNLPDTMNAEYLEKTLYYDGQSALLKSPDYSFMNMKCSNEGLNFYDNPVNLHCYSHNISYDRQVYTGLDSENEFDEAILVKNNIDSFPTSETLLLFAQRLAECDRTCDVNIAIQKFPFLILCDPKQRSTLENMYNQIVGNIPAIFGDKKTFANGTNSPSIEVLNTDPPYVVDKIMDYKRQIWNEVLTFLGINNLSDEKKERMIQDEINSNNELINLNLQSFYAPRKKACDEFNKKFNLTGEKAISVRLRSDLKNIIKNTESSIVQNHQDYVNKENKEGEENE